MDNTNCEAPSAANEELASGYHPSDEDHQNAAYINQQPGQLSIGYTGASNGFAAVLVFLLEQRITIAVLSNLKSAQPDSQL